MKTTIGTFGVALFILAMGEIGPAGEASPSWHHPLYLGQGEWWRQRVEVVVTNASEREMAGTVVTVKIGRGEGEADLVGAEAQAVRVCNVRGEEMLYDLRTETGPPLRQGPLPAGAELALPVECPARAQATYYVYFDNPAAWLVPDFLVETGKLRNGSLEEGEGLVPTGWKHDANDDQHWTFWTEKEAHSGTRCLKTWVAPGAKPTWISTRQSHLQILGGARYVMTAWVKAENVKGYAGWYIHVGNEQNSMILSPILRAGGGTFDWKPVRREFTAPPEADRAELGTVLWGTGIAWFDDVTLECLDDEVWLSAWAGPREQLALREVGGPESEWDEPPDEGRSWEYRAPVQVVNQTEEPMTEGLISVDLATALSRLRGRVAPGSFRLIDGEKVIPHYRLGERLLFQGEVPARTVKTFYLYFSTDLQAGGAQKPPGQPKLAAQYAPHPALPGGGRESAQGVALNEYAALLGSPKNRVRNPSFEAGIKLPEDWSGGAEGEHPAGTEMGLVPEGLFGPRCARIYVPADAQQVWTGWRQDVPVQPGRTYLYAAWLKCEDLEGGLQLHAHRRTATGELVREDPMTGAGPALNGTRDWTLLSGMFTMPEDCARFQLHLTMRATGTAWHDGVLLVEVTPATLQPLERRPQEAPDLAVWPVNALVKVFRDDLPPREISGAQLTAARNEREPLQLAIRSATDRSGVKVQVVGPTGPGGATLAETEIGVIGYVPIDAPSNYYSNRTPSYYRKVPQGPGACDGWPGWWPDPVLPQNHLDLVAGQTQPVWITVRIPPEASAGTYRGAVRLVADGSALAEIPFTVQVWDFTLPDQSHLKAIYDCRQGGDGWQVPGQSPQQSREAFWKFMAEHRVCPDTIKPEPLISYRNGEVVADFRAFDRAAEYYFDGLRFPHAYTPWSFYLFGWGHLPGEKFGEPPYEGEYPYEGVDRSRLRPEFKRAYQACLQTYWEHVREKGWADRIVLYISDEPHDSDPSIRAQMRALCDMIHEVDPAIRIYSSTWHHQPEWNGYLDVWGIGHYGVVPVPKMQELRVQGATIWWTTDGQMCTDTPYCAIERLLPHYCFKYGAEGYEFWGIDWLTYDPYQYGWHRFLLHDFGPATEKSWVRYPNGDGFLAYPPGPLNLDRPVSSIRLEQAREGVEDYEYLYLLRELVRQGQAAGKDVSLGEKALETAHELVESPCEIGRYSTRILPDPEQVLRVKTAVAQAIERLSR